MQSCNQSYSSQEDLEVQHYVKLMQQHGIHTIVEMNKYISKHNIWNYFMSIRRENTYSSGFKSIGISKNAYKTICKLYQTHDFIITSLIEQKMI